MTTYSTRTLAEKIMTAAAEANMKAATRTLRKFLRDELGEGKAVVGKGNRYALDFNAKEITALKKKFAAWEVAQAEAQAARRALLDSRKVIKVTAEGIEEITKITADSSDEAAPAPDEAPAIEGPTDEEIAAMLSDEDEGDTPA